MKKLTCILCVMIGVAIAQLVVEGQRRPSVPLLTPVTQNYPPAIEYQSFMQPAFL